VLWGGVVLWGRVPTLTYTLLDHAAVAYLWVFILYPPRRGGVVAQYTLGHRAGRAPPRRWVAVEWPERAPQLETRCDVELEFVETPAGGRRVTVAARTRLGIEALSSLRDGAFNNGP
jgi:hypothetical protein